MYPPIFHLNLFVQIDNDSPSNSRSESLIWSFPLLLAPPNLFKALRAPPGVPMPEWWFWYWEKRRESAFEAAESLRPGK